MPDVRKGMAIRYNGEIYFIVDFSHTHMGRGGATLRLKLKNATTGLTKEVSFKDDSEIEEVHIERRPATFSYIQGENYHFLDSETYEDILFKKEQIEDILGYIKEGMEVMILYAEGMPINVEPPTFVELEVVETDPGLKGDTASGGSKPAKLETGKVIQVPLFIQVGDKIRIDTRTDKYIERVK